MSFLTKNEIVALAQYIHSSKQIAEINEFYIYVREELYVRFKLISNREELTNSKFQRNPPPPIVEDKGRRKVTNSSEGQCNREVRGIIKVKVQR